MTTTTAPATRTEAPCLRCEGTPGRWIAPDGSPHTCFGCNGLGVVLLTPASLKARATRRARAARPVSSPAQAGPRVDCAHCEDTGRLVNYGWATGNPCRHCS